MKVEQSGEGRVTISLEKVDVRLSAADLASCVASMDATGQASFLAALGREFADFKGSLGWGVQALSAGEALGSHEDGARALELLRHFLEAGEEALAQEVMSS